MLVDGYFSCVANEPLSAKFLDQLHEISVKKLELSELSSLLPMRDKKHTNFNIKRLELIDPIRFDYWPADAATVRCKIDDALHLIAEVPPSERLIQIEVAQRFKETASRKMKKLPKIEKSVRKKMENSYNDNNLNAVKFEPKLEMLLIEAKEKDFDEVIDIFREKITDDRIKSSFRNLKGLSIGWIHHKSALDLIGKRIINVIGNRLVSLHIDARFVWNENFVVMIKAYGSKKLKIAELKKQKWYFGRLEELCWDETMMNRMKDSHLWYLFDNKLFPKLKYLKICHRFNNASSYQLFRRFDIGSLMDANLEAFHLALYDWHLPDFGRNGTLFPGKLLTAFTNSIKKRNIKKNKDFILKLQFHVNIRSQDEFFEENIDGNDFFQMQSEFELLVGTLMESFTNIMVGGKVRYHYGRVDLELLHILNQKAELE